MKILGIVSCMMLILTCLANDSGLQELNLSSFKISVPKEWKYIKQQGEDSFIGKIKISKLTSLTFDCSGMGYANSLIPTEQQYLNNKEWDKHFFYKVGVTYTANFNLHNAKMELMKEKGISDSSLVHVEADPVYETVITIHQPTPKQKIKYPKADYIADMIYRDSTIQVPIEIPVAIKSHYIQIDSTDNYVTKTIWPKAPGKGMTGIYIHSRTSSFNFQMAGINLSPQNQALALKAFKTIKFIK